MTVCKIQVFFLSFALKCVHGKYIYLHRGFSFKNQSGLPIQVINSQHKSTLRVSKHAVRPTPRIGTELY